jgi:hypothetical protein
MFSPPVKCQSKGKLWGRFRSKTWTIPSFSGRLNQGAVAVPTQKLVLSCLDLKGSEGRTAVVRTAPDHKA